MPRQNEDCDVVDHFIHAECLARLGILGCHALGHHIAGGFARLNRIQSSLRQTSDQPQDFTRCRLCLGPEKAVASVWDRE